MIAAYYQLLQTLVSNNIVVKLFIMNYRYDYT